MSFLQKKMLILSKMFVDNIQFKTKLLKNYHNNIVELIKTQNVIIFCFFLNESEPTNRLRIFLNSLMSL